VRSQDVDRFGVENNRRRFARSWADDHRGANGYEQGKELTPYLYVAEDKWFIRGLRRSDIGSRFTLNDALGVQI
jgi:hypothetical protein